MSLPILQTLRKSEWRERQERHRERMLRATGPHRERSRRQEKHTVCDFFFSYYSYRPSQLEAWHPGLGVALEDGAGAWGEPRHPSYRESSQGVYADPGWINASRYPSLRWTLALLRATRERPPTFGCFGLHEWAMVYRAPENRHPVPLRFSRNDLATIVESQTLRCTHFDAFRFFTLEARPLNRHQLERTDIPKLEQRGCLHANMDLYKWAFKLAPFVCSDLIADTFELAWAIREVDMRASPYDLRALGYAPICIETTEGRLEYEQHQRAFAERAIPLRERLVGAYEAICAAVAPGSSAHA